jgi:hypothetical protein
LDFPPDRQSSQLRADPAIRSDREVPGASVDAAFIAALANGDANVLSPDELPA